MSVADSKIAWGQAARQAAFERWIASIAPRHGLQLASLAPASADASFRRYLRIGADTAAGGSLIVMDAPPPLEDVRPFVHVAGLAAPPGLHAPRVLEADVEHGFLLLTDLAATVSHLVRSGQPLYSSLEELAQVSHLLARWHMPEHLKTRRTSSTWMQWLAVVVPALWLVLLWAMQLRAGTRRRSRARRGTRFLHPLVQLALCQGAGAGLRTREALDEFLARQCLLVVSPPPEEACMYVLASRLDVYVGITATARAGPHAAGAGAACRYWEHLVEIRKPTATGPADRAAATRSSA